jgi:hypothetical protein
MILWDVLTGNPLRIVQHSAAGKEELHCCAFAPANNNFVIVSSR